MSTSITATGNAGIVLRTPRACVCVDVFWEQRYVSDATRLPPTEDVDADCILVTHGHWDHFSPDHVARAAARRGATVLGPAEVTRTLRGAVPAEALITVEPARGASVVKEFAWGAVRTIRTHHGRAHNSYLIETDGARIFHDGDNEDTRLLDAAALASLDALFLCPWQGSGWEDFVERAAPRRWFLIHLYEEEIAAHRAGRFLTELSARVPAVAPIIALSPGETHELASVDATAPAGGDAT